MPLLENDTYTIDYIYSLPEGQRAELIDGKIYNMAPPSRIHQKTSGELYTIINNHIKSKKEIVKSTLPHLQSFSMKMTKHMSNQIFLLSAIRTN